MRSQGVRLEGPKLFNIQRHRSLPKILPSSAPQAIRARAGCERYLSESPSGAVSYARTRFQGDLAPSGNNGEKRVASVPRGTVLKSRSTDDRFAYVHLDPCQSPFFFLVFYIRIARVGNVSTDIGARLWCEWKKLLDVCGCRKAI